MPQDSNLYGQPPPKKRKNNLALSTSLDFAAQLSSLIAYSPSASPTPARPCPPRFKYDKVASARNKRRHGGDTADINTVTDHSTFTAGDFSFKHSKNTHEETQVLDRTRRKMEEKARLYAAMKRGDYVAQNNEPAPLIDFDRKWADSEARGDRDDHHNTSSSSDEEDGCNNNDVIEYEDEFGRLRRGTVADKERFVRQRRRGLLGAEELESMSARPAAPAKLLYGDAIQTMAFNPDDPDKMEELARRRDRSATPPEMKHYDADSEIRTKGAGFYKFSKDEATRVAELGSLGEQRQRTEATRADHEEQRERRRREIEQRRKDVGARKAKKLADSFLDGLAADMKGSASTM
ncbi:Uncharacterized protein C8035_v009522 [Colletotrichum spinosum]|uniref:Coiled-coil domain-containing protein 174 n=1 Tax=Colletotrichum spinosum TaxID=1347390 RepID=A0A4R8PSL7_9PEZI|nr:Uncharacterized protein C8035_v009522 [Colletotrichum spinosum]